MKKVFKTSIFFIIFLFISLILVSCNIFIYPKDKIKPKEDNNIENIYFPIVAHDKENKYSSKVNDQIFNFLKKYYYKDLGTLDYINATNKSTESFLKSLTDMYTNVSFNESKRILTPLSQNVEEKETFEGYGFTYKYIDEKLVVTNIFRNGNARKKLYPNDEIIGVIDNGKKLYFKDYKLLPDQIALLLKKDASNKTPKTFIILRNNKQLLVSMYLKPFLNSSVEKIDTKNPNFVSLKINKFDEFTGKIFNKYLKEAEENILKDKSKTLIIDLRNNPGGVVGSLNEIVENLLPKKNHPYFILETENKNEEKKQLIKTYGTLKTKKPYNIKVLVNKFSASASEILAAVLHYGGGYEIIGEETFGKNVFQDHALLFDGYINLTYTRGYWSYYNFEKNKFEKIDKEKNPIPITKLNEIDVYRFFEIPYLKEEDIKYDTVNLNIIYIQNFLNYYFKNTPNFIKIRNDGYFDKNTEILLEKFQKINNLKPTKILDTETKNKIYDYYLDLLFIVEKDIYYNHILN